LDKVLTLNFLYSPGIENNIKVLEFTNWKIGGERRTGKLLGIKRTTLDSRMKKLNIQRP
jgi:transcriptional regulator of acetoin/glycerol metabolism